MITISLYDLQRVAYANGWSTRLFPEFAENEGVDLSVEWDLLGVVARGRALKRLGLPVTLSHWHLVAEALTGLSPFFGVIDHPVQSNYPH